jgi:hypothetical protein
LTLPINNNGINYYKSCIVEADITVTIAPGVIYSNDTLLYYRIKGFDLTNGDTLSSKVLNPESVIPEAPNIKLKIENILPDEFLNAGIGAPPQFDKIEKYPTVTAQIYVEVFYRNTSGTTFSVVSPPFNYSMILYIPNIVYKN